MMSFRKFISIVLTLIILSLSTGGCEQPHPSSSDVSSINAVDSMTQSNTSQVESQEDSSIPETTVATTSATKWLVKELSFTSAYDEKDSPYLYPFTDIQMEVEFSGPNGIKMTLPTFWDGEQTWKVRFAPPETGTWTYRTVSSYTKDSGLHNLIGKLEVTPYTGDLEIYKRGFVTVGPNSRYFTYNDGTPFFYLGDTHWNMPDERFDDSEIPTIPSQFKYIVDKRVSQGFTVYQSEPIGATYFLANGFNEDDLEGFRDLDRKFEYIATKGLVHANAQLFFSNELAFNNKRYSDEYLKALSRYWVARYSAYPVLWTTAQEVDNDSYYNKEGFQKVFSAANNPWKKVASWTHEYDPYKHPMTAHMEYASIGYDGTNADTSSFKDLEGHNWFASQWSSGKSQQVYFAIPKNFWNSGKLTINYEGRYDHLWTKEFGARAQGWQAYLNGMYGYGYGAIDIWLYNSTYDMAEASNMDGDIITVDDKKIKWNVSVDFPSAKQMGYMKEFFSKINWWELTPRFDDNNWYRNSGGFYSVASDGNNTYVAYFYNSTLKTGSLYGLDNTEYTSTWYNPRENTYTPLSKGFMPTKDEKTGNLYYDIGIKPDTKDWVLIVTKKDVK